MKWFIIIVAILVLTVWFVRTRRTFWAKTLVCLLMSVAVGLWYFHWFHTFHTPNDGYRELDVFISPVVGVIYFGFCMTILVIGKGISWVRTKCKKAREEFPTTT